jgi:hypothetical protein
VSLFKQFLRKGVIMNKIRIISTPPGFPEERIRKAWIGIEIPIAPESEVVAEAERTGRSRASVIGYVVRGEDAVNALLLAGRDEEARFWMSPMPPNYLAFSKDCCEVI